MQRLVEQLADVGDVWDGPTRLGRVHYHLSVYQQFSGVEGESVPASFEVEGQFAPLDRFDVGALHLRRAELTLHLPDGRRLECLMSSGDGRIRSTGRSLYTP